MRTHVLLLLQFLQCSKGGPVGLLQSGTQQNTRIHQKHTRFDGEQKNMFLQTSLFRLDQHAHLLIGEFLEMDGHSWICMEIHGYHGCPSSLSTEIGCPSPAGHEIRHNLFPKTCCAMSLHCLDMGGRTGPRSSGTHPLRDAYGTLTGQREMTPCKTWIPMQAMDSDSLQLESVWPRLL
jgi:hypothetical protein